MSASTTNEQIEADDAPSAPAPSSRDALQDHLQAFEAALEAQHTTYADALCHQVDALADLLARLQRKHDAIRLELSLDDLGERVSSAPADESAPTTEAWRDLWQCLCNYRRRFGEEILPPIRAHCEKQTLAQEVTGALRALTASLNETVDTLPEHVTRPEPATLYLATQHDSWWLRGRKLGGRLLRRTWDLVPGSETERQQVVPLRQLARHYTQDLLRQQQSTHADVRARLIAWMADMERTATAVTHALLEYEQRFDHLEFHHTQQTERVPLQPPVRPLDVADALDEPPAPPAQEDVDDMQKMIRQVDVVLERGAALCADGLHTTLRTRCQQAMAAMKRRLDQPQPPPRSRPSAEGRDATVGAVVRTGGRTGDPVRSDAWLLR